jgi:hypothetical protein
VGLEARQLLSAYRPSWSAKVANTATLCSTILITKYFSFRHITFLVHVVKKFLTLMKSFILPYPHPDTIPYYVLKDSFIKVNFSVIFSFMCMSATWFLLSKLSVFYLLSSSWPHFMVTRPALFILLALFIVRIILRVGLLIIMTSLRRPVYLHSPVTSYLLGQNFILAYCSQNSIVCVPHSQLAAK